MILVTGAQGFIGSALVKFLRERGYEVEEMNEEITDIEKMRPHFKHAEFVVHLAAKVVHTPEEVHDLVTEKRPYSFFQVNVGGTMNVVNLCLEYGCKLINTSSTTVDTKYGISKTLAEEMVRLYAKYQGLRAVTIRPCVIYDEREGKRPYISRHYPLGKLMKDIEEIIVSYDFKKYKLCEIGGLGQRLYSPKVVSLKKKIKSKLRGIVKHA